MWVLERGSYSDYRVLGVFSTKRNAERAAKFLDHGSETPTVAEWPLNPAIAELSRGYDQWNIIMLRDGTVERCDRNDSPYDFDTAGFLWERTKAPAYIGKGIPDALNVTVWARSARHAIKVANEKRAQMIAGNEWKP